MGEDGFQFFQNRDCEYFPCHSCVEAESFNCLFCYCPLYLLGRECGGNFTYLPNGVKSCQGCTVPHGPGGYAHVTGRYPMILERLRAQEEKKE